MLRRSPNVQQQRERPCAASVRSRCPCSRCITRPNASPAIAQLAQPHEYGLRIRALADVRKGFAQPRDHRWVLQPEEGVDALLLAERGHRRLRRVVMTRLTEQAPRVLVARLAIEREFEVACQVLVTRVDASGVRQPCEL